MVLKNPDAPASQKQLKFLHGLTGIDYEDSGLTMLEAHEIIEQVNTPEGLIRFELERSKGIVIDDSEQPFSEPQNTLIEGRQRSGKTLTGVAKICDEYDKDCVAKYLDAEGIKDYKVIGFDIKHRTASVKIKGKPQIIKIPKSYKLVSDIRVFANIHLYGIKYVYCPSYAFIVQALKADLIRNGYLLMDEYYIGAFNREGMKAVAKELAKNSNQYAKRMLKTIITAPIASQLDWSARLLPTEHITTDYDKRTRIVTATIKKKGVHGTKIVPFDSTKYRCRYWTNESVHR